MLRREVQPSFIAFNQDFTCLCVANSHGIIVHSLETRKAEVVFTAQLGAIKLCEMLFCTSLLAYVGAGEQPKLTPRKLSLLNTVTQNVIQDLHFPSTVLAVKLNRKSTFLYRLVAVLEQRTFVHALESLEQLSTIETPPNPRGVCALTVGVEPCYLALPSQTETGSIRVYDASEGINVLAELSAHKSSVAAMAWNDDGTLLASASDKGTVLRVHSFPQASRVFSFRRGTSHAQIHCLAFSAAGVSPALLACASSHGTIHLWVVDRLPSSNVPSGSYLLSVIPSSVTDIVDPQRCIANLRLPAGVPAVCAIQTKRLPATSHMLDSTEDSSEEGVATLLVATQAAILYTYQIQNLTGAGSPTFGLEDECYLLSLNAQNQD